MTMQRPGQEDDGEPNKGDKTVLWVVVFAIGITTFFFLMTYFHHGGWEGTPLGPP
jgi:hypothetical protein